MLMGKIKAVIKRRKKMLRATLILVMIGLPLVLGSLGLPQSGGFGLGIIEPSTYYSETYGIRRGQSLDIHFHADGPINFYIMTRSAFEAWKNHQPFETLVKVENISQYQSIFSVPHTGVYVIVLDNSFSTTSKNVELFSLSISGRDYDMLTAGVFIITIGFATMAIGALRKSTKPTKPSVSGIPRLSHGKSDGSVRRFGVLVLREIRLILSFPVLEIIVFLAALIFSNNLSFSETTTVEGGVGALIGVLLNGYSLLLLMMISVLVPYSVAGESSSGVMLVLLSQPIKRFRLLSAKFLACFIAVFAAISVPTTLFAFVAAGRFGVLLPISAYAIAAIGILLWSLAFCSVSTMFSVLMTNTLAASMCSLFTLFLWGFFLKPQEKEILLLTYTNGMRAILTYLLSSWAPNLSKNIFFETFSLTDFLIALTNLLIISIVTLTTALLLFNRKDIK